MRRSSALSGLCVSSLSLQSEVLEEELLDGNHIVISIEPNHGNFYLPTHALADSGATGYAFAGEEFVRGHGLSLFKLKQPRSLEVINGHPVEAELSPTSPKYQLTLMDIRKNYLCL